MINYEDYLRLKEEFGYTSSWAVWAEPGNGNWKSKDLVSDMSVFRDENSLVKMLNGGYVFVGLNPANRDDKQHTDNSLGDDSNVKLNPADHGNEQRTVIAWKNFHFEKEAQDYKLRYALRDTEYWGAFITDVYPGITDTDSNRAMERVTQSKTNESVENLLRIRELLGGKATIVAVGTKAHAILKKNLPSYIELKMITHFSHHVNIEKYREKVLEQLR